MNKTSIKRIAQAMGSSEQFIRKGLQQQIFPWGYAVKNKQKYTYWINTEKFTEYTGIEIEN